MLVILIAVWFSGQQRSSGDYLLAGRSMGWIVVGISQLASLFGVHGITLLVLFVNSVLALAVYMRIIVPMYRQEEVPHDAASIWIDIVTLTALLATVTIGLAAQFFFVKSMA